MRLEVTVCNLCQPRGPGGEVVIRATRQYEITRDGQSATVDLCGEHDQILDQLLSATEGREVPTSPTSGKPAVKSTGKVSTQPKAPNGTRGRRAQGGTPVMTLEEIERKKREEALIKNGS